MHNAFANGSRLFGAIENLYISNIKLPSNNLRISNSMNIEKIANSIRQHGLLHPIVVRPKENYFEIVAGCRRFLACKSLKWKKIPCHIVHLDEAQTFELALVENIRRKSFTPLEEANAFKMYVADNGWGSIAELSKKIGKSSSSIVRRMNLLDLPPDVLDKIKNSDLSPSSAEELHSIKDPGRQSHLAKLIARRHLTVKKVRKMVKEDPFFLENSDVEVRSELQAIDQTIIALRIAMNKVISILEENSTANENFVLRELLLNQKNNLHGQIDILINAKLKYSKKILRYRNILKK